MPRGRRLRRPWFATPLAIFAASRVLVLFAAFAARWYPNGKGVLAVLASWDGGWYRHVAERGYPTTVLSGTGDPAQSALGFFPLFPLLTKAVVAATGVDWRVAGVLVNTAAAAVAVVLIWRLAERRWDAAVANRAALLVSFFPGSYALSLTYTEGLFLAGAAGCLLLLDRQRWWAAALVAGVTSASRPSGYVLALCCAFAVVMHWRRTRESRPLLSPPLALAGLVAFMAYLHVHAGDAFAYQRTQERGWDQRIDFGRTTLRRTVDFVTGPTDDPTILTATLMLGVLVGLLVVFFRSRPPGVWVVYTVALLVPGLITESIVAMPRFVLTAFPLLLTAARAVRHDALATVLAVSAGVLGVFTYMLGTGWLTP